VKLKALLLCEDVRFEAAGTVTLVGVFNERIIVTAEAGPIVLPRLAFVAVVGGLKRVERIGFRQWIRFEAEEPGDERPLIYEPHDPEMDEHNFVLSQSPMIFPDAGTYEVAIDVEVGGRTQGYRYPFALERAS
jgi:hypothetical protein